MDDQIATEDERLIDLAIRDIQHGNADSVARAIQVVIREADKERREATDKFIKDFNGAVQ